MAAKKRVKKTMSRRITAAERGPDMVVDAPAVLPLIAVAVRLLETLDRDVIYIAADERRADEIGRVLARLAPTANTMVFPPWDCMPFDRASPSRESMGRRMAVLQRIAKEDRPPALVVTTVDASMQRTPPIGRIVPVQFAVITGEPVDVDAFRRFAVRAGYQAAERVAEPGDFACHGQTIEIFPPSEAEPCRVELRDGSAAEIHTFDPLTQRSIARRPSVAFGPATERLAGEGEADEAHPAGGGEHDLVAFYGGQPLPSLFDHLPGATILAAPGSDERRQAFFDGIDEAVATQANFGSLRSHAVEAQPLYLDADAWSAVLECHEERNLPDAQLGPAPNFTADKKPAHAFQAFVDDATRRGRRVVLTGVPRDLAAFARHLERHGGQVPEPAETWSDVLAAPAGAFKSLDLDLDEGTDDLTHDIVVVAAADVMGTRVHHAGSTHAATQALSLHPPMQLGDTVIHEDHGIGILRGLETIDVAGHAHDAVRLEYHGGDSLLVPVEDLDRLWRYGSDADAVPLDRLHTDAWAKRRVELQRAVVDTARVLVDLANERLHCTAPRLVAPEKDFARFCARFSYPLTPDQSRAVTGIGEDLASGRPMDRLVCGDVGYGKTEVALRAAAIALMAGKQVALVAPTTVLAHQQLEGFRKRFKGFGFEIAGLSRLEASAEASRVKTGLADGSIRMVVGTHAVAGASVAFQDLGLMILDEEQKFGSKLKARLKDMAGDGHMLTLTATPIPRTLELALVGVQTVSVIATPPVRRRPIRTFVEAVDPAALRSALLREHARGGQSFVIAPRIADIEGLRTRLAAIVPELAVLVAHGELPAEDVDEAMVAFAHGRGDVLLATNIVESGLDVPRANTMLVWDAGRFGLAQLHQLRGRVGRGRAQGVAYLLTEPETPFPESTRARLAALQTLDRLGAGFAISMRDLDLRGAGDLVGDEQAGHLRLVGLELYQNLLARAVRLAKSEAVDDAAPAELHLDQVGRIPEAYLSEPDLRIEFYARLSRLDSGKAVRALRAEIEDRFGPPPEELDWLLARARLRIACRQFRASALHVGPKAVAMTMPADRLQSCRELAEAHPDMTMKGPKLVWTGAPADADGFGRAEAFFDLLEDVSGAAAASDR